MNDGRDIEWTQNGEDFVLSLLREERGEGPEANACLYVGGWGGDEHWGMSEGENLATGIDALIEVLEREDPDTLVKVRGRLEQERHRSAAEYKAWVEESMRQAGLR